MMTSVLGDMRETSGNRAALALQALQEKFTGPTQHAADFSLCIPIFGNTQDALNVF